MRDTFASEHEAIGYAVVTSQETGDTQLVLVPDTGPRWIVGPSGTKMTAGYTIKGIARAVASDEPSGWRVR